MKEPAKTSRELWEFDQKLRTNNDIVVAGCDEVGRGSVAGSIVACCAVIPNDVFIEGINDSKRVGPKRRQRLWGEMGKQGVMYTYGECSAKEIDQIGIDEANSLAILRAVAEMKNKLSGKTVLFIIDSCPLRGSNRVPRAIYMDRADSTSYAVAAASIAAKVVRDSQMDRMDSQYPGYGFSSNKGYLSKDHKSAIELLGPCEIHRKSFNLYGNRKE